MSATLVISEDRLFAPVSLRQIDGYAHIDTGARYSSILQAHSVQFPSVGSREIRGALGATSVPQVCLDEIHFLGELSQDVVVDVQPDAQGDLDTLPFQVALALGCDVLLRKPLCLNFVESEISYRVSNMLDKTERLRLETNFGMGIPIFQFSFRNHVLDAVFDTGGGMSLLNQRLLGVFQAVLIDDEPIEVEDATGTKHIIPTFKCNDLAMGDYPLGGIRFLVVDLNAVEQEKHMHIDFVFGLNAMTGKRWLVNKQESCIEMM